MKSIEEIKNIIDRQKPFLKDKYKVKEIGIFGSYIKSKQNSNSDVDILVDFFDYQFTMFDFIELENYLSDLISTNVDLVMKKTLKPYISKQILSEVIYV